MARAVSTVLDVSVCLLLVGVSVTTLVMAVPAQDASQPSMKERTTSSLGTITASIPAGDGRRVHDTLAGHLATAALVNATLKGNHLEQSSYPDEVRRTVRGHVPERTHITVRWRPYPAAPLQGRLAVGSEPPATADVSASKVSIDSGMAPPESATTIDALAHSVSTAYVTTQFPPERSRIGLVDTRTGKPTAARYRTVADALGVDIDQALAAALPTQANGLLASALADRLAEDLRGSYDSTTAAENDATVGDVEIVIRRWEP